MFIKPFRTLSFALLLIVLVCAVFAYQCIWYPASVLSFFWVEDMDYLHHALMMYLGFWMIVTAVAAGIALYNPLKRKGIILVLIATHLSIAIGDIILLSQGQILGQRWFFFEITYMLIICALLVRFFPSEHQLKLFHDAMEHQKTEIEKMAKENLQFTKDEDEIPSKEISTDGNH